MDSLAQTVGEQALRKSVSMLSLKQFQAYQEEVGFFRTSRENLTIQLCQMGDVLFFKLEGGYPAQISKR